MRVAHIRKPFNISLVCDTNNKLTELEGKGYTIVDIKYAMCDSDRHCESYSALIMYNEKVEVS